MSHKLAIQGGITTLASVAACALALKVQGSLTLPDLLLIGFIGALIGAAFGSFLSSPAQFARASWERLTYAAWVPIAIFIMLIVLGVRVAILVAKVGLKVILAAIAAIAYAIMPFDLLPDFLLGLGQIDDFLVVLTLGVWAMGAAVTGKLRSSLVITRPQTPFP